MAISATDVETLLAPVSVERPCGENLQYESAFVQLQELARGKPEQAIGDTVRAAQDPPWEQVRTQAELLLRSTKDLRVSGILHCALLKTEGIAGLSASLALTQGLLERYWESVYPLLDVEDDNDPTFRINCLVASLAGEQAIGTLRQITLVESRKFGRHSLRQYRIVTGGLKVNSAAQQSAQLAQDLARLEAAFQDVDIAALKLTAQAAARAAEHLGAIEKTLLDRSGGIPEALGSLHADVKEINAVFAAQLAKRGEAVPAGAPCDDPEPPREPPAPAAQGEIRNRADVVRTLDALCDYYVRNEPSSPIPLLLQRAKRLVDKGFMEIMHDLAPAGVAEAEAIGGLEKKES